MVQSRFPLLLAALFIVTAPRTVNAESEGLKTALTISGAVLGGISAYKFFDWLLSRTDQEVISAGHDLCHEALLRYRPLSDCCARHLGRAGSWHTEGYTIPLLDDVYSFLKDGNSAIYLQQMDVIIDAMSNEQNEVIKRITKLSKKNQYEQFKTLRDLERLRSELIEKSSWLKRLYYFINAHSAYFDVKHQVDTLSHDYRNELHVVASSYGRSLNLESALAVHIVSSCYNYPYLSYYKKIDLCCSQLKKSMQQLRFDYHSLESEAQRLLDHLMVIKRYVRADKRYAQELHNKRIEALEKERVEIERQMLIIKKQKLWTEQAKAEQLKKQTRLKEEELLLKAQEMNDQKRNSAVIFNQQIVVDLDHFFDSL